MKHHYIIILELVLVMSIVFVMLTSQALGKMSCNRIANYFLVPVLIGTFYFNFASYQRNSSVQSFGQPVEMLTVNDPGKEEEADNSAGDSIFGSLDRIDQWAWYVLTALTFVQMAANLLFHRLLPRILS